MLESCPTGAKSANKSMCRWTLTGRGTQCTQWCVTYVTAPCCSPPPALAARPRVPAAWPSTEGGRGCGVWVSLGVEHQGRVHCRTSVTTQKFGMYTHRHKIGVQSFCNCAVNIASVFTHCNDTRECTHNNNDTQSQNARRQCQRGSHVVGHTVLRTSKHSMSYTQQRMHFHDYSILDSPGRLKVHV